MEENELKNICRTCMTDEGIFQSIFIPDTPGISTHLAEMIMAYASVQITPGDGLPEQICTKCTELVKQFYSFKLKCEGTDMILRSKLRRSPLPKDSCGVQKEQIALELDEVMIKSESSSDIDEQPENEMEIIETLIDPTKIEIIDKPDICQVILHDEETELESEDVKFECDTCSKCYKRKDTLARHKKTHLTEDEDEPDLDKQCVLCDMHFEDETQYKIHVSTEHTKEKSFACKICSRAFAKIYRLNRHMKVHSVKPHLCPQCGKSYARADQLTNHLNTHSGVKPHVCQTCSKSFNQISNLKDHVRVHNGEKPFLCSTCGKGFNHLGNLRQHTVRHTGIKSHLCSICGSGFTTKGGLSAHSKKHTGARPYVCPICSRGFTTGSSLKKHNRIHSGEKPYECEFCKMKFNRSGHLVRHKRTHTGEKPYVCKFCTKAFSQSNDLNTHQRIHTGEKPYICDNCGQAFRQSSALKTHKKIHERSMKITLTEPQ